VVIELQSISTLINNCVQSFARDVVKVKVDVTRIVVVDSIFNFISPKWQQYKQTRKRKETCLGGAKSCHKQVSSTTKKQQNHI